MTAPEPKTDYVYIWIYLVKERSVMTVGLTLGDKCIYFFFLHLLWSFLCWLIQNLKNKTATQHSYLSRPSVCPCVNKQ